MTARLGHGIAVHPQTGHTGEPRPHLDFQLLGPLPAVTDPVELALGTPRGRGNLVLAVMASRFLSLPMVSQRDVAMRAFDHVSAGRTLDGRRIAAPVEQQDHLTIVAQRLLHRLVQRLADRSTTALSMQLRAQIDDRHVGQWQRGDAPRHVHQPIVPALRGVPALERRRGGTEHQRHVLGQRPLRGDVTSMVARSRVLLERRVVFLVDHDQPQVRCGCEHGTAGSHHHLHFTRRRCVASASAVRAASGDCAARPRDRTATGIGAESGASS